MDESKRFSGVQNREMILSDISVRVLSTDEGGDEEGRTVELSFSSETPVMMYGAYEVLSHKKSAVMLDRLNNGGCLLFNHHRDKILGAILKAGIKNKRGVAVVKFDDDEESLMYLGKVKSGSLRNVSTGYMVHEYERSVKGKGEAAEVTYTATLWEPVEISLVSIPADPTVGVGREMAEDTGSAKRTFTGHSTKTVDCQIKINQNKLKMRR